MRLKLTFLLLFVGLIPTLTVSLVAYVTISRELTSTTTKQLQSTATRQERRIAATIQARKEETVKIANRYTLQSRLSTYFTNGSKTADAAAISAILRSEKIENASIEAIYLTNTQGNVIATSANSSRSAFLDGRQWLPSNQAGQGGVTFALREDPQDNINKLFAAMPVTVNQKDTIVMTVIFGVEDIVSTVQDYTGLGESGETMLAAPADGKQNVSLFSLRFDHEAALKRQLPALEASTADKTYTTTDYRGHEVIISTKSVSGVDWRLAVKLDTQEALASVGQLRNILVLIVLCSSVGIIMLALYFTHLFTKPIIALTENTRQIMQGNFTQHITVASHDEVGILATAFNKMADELAGYYRKLEDKVKERTQALDQKVRQLSDAKAKDEAILSSMGEGMIVTDSKGQVLLLNQLAGDLLGLETTGIIGKPLEQNVLYDENKHILPPEERPMQIALCTGKRLAKAVMADSDSGDQKRALFITATPVMQHDSIIGVVQIIRDITKEKEVDRMKTEFISLASHQLRTPLSAISWFSELLLTENTSNLTDEQREFLEDISTSTVRMIQLVNSLLNISRIESGRIIINPKPTDLRELVSGVVNDLQAKIKERNQHLAISVHEGLPQINLDPQLIGQVYLNLLTNAIKYTPKDGEITVLISRKGHEIVTQVSDNGYGIPLDQQHKLFQKFFRAANAVTIETDGTGLGLYLVKAIIESSGGKIWFKSVEGKGTSFWFSFPDTGMKAKAGEVTLDG